jgi:hypothetical protein
MAFLNFIILIDADGVDPEEPVIPGRAQVNKRGFETLGDLRSTAIYKNGFSRVGSS